MDITFNKDGEFYVAEFEVTADFALHIERSDVGTIQLFQNTGSSHGYAIVEDFRFDNRNKLVIDYDTPVLIPKRIRIESEVEPTYCSIVSSGEITEIKSQAKSIEITSNGTTSVEPDAGFSYLSKVDVKTNVPMSGGGASTVEYLDFREVGVNQLLLNSSIFAAGYAEEGDVVLRFVLPPSILDMFTKDVEAVMIDFNQQVISPVFGNEEVSAQQMTLLEMLISQGVTLEDIASIPRMTKEEFYAKGIFFIMDGINWVAHDGMTWQEFVDSSYYNDGKFSFSTSVTDGRLLLTYDGYTVRRDGSTDHVYSDEAIIPNETYVVIKEK